MLTAGVLALDVDKLNRDWRWMLDTLRSVLARAGQEALVGALQDRASELQIDDESLDRVELTQAMSIAFQFLGSGLSGSDRTRAGDGSLARVMG